MKDNEPEDSELEDGDSLFGDATQEGGINQYCTNNEEHFGPGNLVEKYFGTILNECFWLRYA